jgi:steroid delta-isomerase-like uncharacterized protein
MLPLLALIVFVGCESQEQSGDRDALTDMAARYAAAWSSQDPASLASFYAEDGSLTVNGGTPSVGRDAVEESARAFMTAFPDMVVRLEKLETEGDKVIFRWHWTGTNTGPGGTGNPVDIHGYEEWTLNGDGQILQSLGHYDDAEYRRQVNAPSGRTGTSH